MHIYYGIIIRVKKEHFRLGSIEKKAKISAPGLGETLNFNFYEVSALKLNNYIEDQVTCGS